MEKVQMLLIRFLLQPLADLMAKLPQRVKDIVFYVSGMLYFLVCFGYGARMISWRYLYMFAACCLLFGVMLLCTMPRKIQPVRFRPLFFGCWMGVGLLALLSGIVNTIDHLPNAVLMLIAFPFFFIVWSNAGWKTVMKKLSRICEDSFLIYFLLSALLMPLTDYRYGGINVNVNNAAAYYALVLSCLIVRILAEKDWKKLIYPVMLFGMAATLLFFTNSRTGMLQVIAAVVVVVPVCFLGAGKKAKLGVLLRLCAAVCSVALWMNLTVPVYQGCYQLGEGLRTTFAAVVKPDADTEDLPDDMEQEETQTTPPVDNIDSYVQMAINKGEKNDQTMAEYSSGRTIIWMGYLKELNLFGHAERISVKYDTRSAKTPHNTVLAIAYDYGIIAGILYVAVNLLSGILAIRFGWKKRREPWALLPLSVVVCFGVGSMLASWESVYIPIAMYYRFVLAPLMVNDEAKEIHE